MSLLIKTLIFCAISPFASAQGTDSFPAINKSVQKLRDMDRRGILQAESASEQQALVDARAEMEKAQTDDTRIAVHRHEENVKALQRELGRLPDSAPVRVSARSVASDSATVSQTLSRSVQAPFWDVYHRNAAPTDFQPL